MTSILARSRHGRFTSVQKSDLANGWRGLQIASAEVFGPRWRVPLSIALACSQSLELAEEKQVANNILKCALQARTNAQLLSVSTGGIRALSREDALKARGEILEAIRRLQAFEKELAKKIDAA
jgi:hypothetical protein